MLTTTSYEVEKVGRLTILEVEGNDISEIQLPKLPSTSRLVLTVEGNGSASIRVNGGGEPGERRWEGEQRTNDGGFRNGNESGYSHVVVTNALPEGDSFTVSVVPTEGQRSLKVRIVELYSDAKLWMLNSIRSFAKCKVCREIIKTLIHAVLLFLGVPPMGLDLVDLDHIGDGIMESLKEWVHEHEHLNEFLRSFLGDQFDLLFELLKKCLQMLSPGNLVAKELCKQMGYCS